MPAIFEIIKFRQRRTAFRISRSDQSARRSPSSPICFEFITTIPQPRGQSELKPRGLISSLKQLERKSSAKTNSFPRRGWELSGRISKRKRDSEWIRFSTNKMRFWTIAQHYDGLVGGVAPIRCLPTGRDLSVSDWKPRHRVTRFLFPRTIRVFAG